MLASQEFRKSTSADRLTFPPFWLQGLRRDGAMPYTIIVSACSSDSATNQYHFFAIIFLPDSRRKAEKWGRSPPRPWPPRATGGTDGGKNCAPA